MERSPDPLHSWYLADALRGAESGEAAIEAALGSGHATLSYGERCFEFTYTAEQRGACFLRLEEVGRLTKIRDGRMVLVFARDGYRAEERVAPCRDGFDAEVLPCIDAGALQALGQALLDDAARALDGKERSP